MMARSLILVAVVAAVTALLRLLPFAVFSGKRKTPAYVLYLGKVLPCAVMAMLVIYCYKGTSFSAYPYGLPQLIAGAATAALHLWKRNTLLSIAGGTVIYMLLVQLVFV